jgi:hypothetical protein
MLDLALPSRDCGTEHQSPSGVSAASWSTEWRAALPKQPRISVVIPAYNGESTLAECLARVFRSSFYESLRVVKGPRDFPRSRLRGQRPPTDGRRSADPLHTPAATERG